MARSKSLWVLVVLLVVGGIYFLFFHKDPLPANHEAIGLGNVHILHDVIGIALLAVAGFLVYRSRRRAAAPLPATS